MMDDLQSGKLAPQDLNEDLFLRNKNKLMDGAVKGWGKGMQKISYDDPDYTLLSKMKRSIYQFSGAKTESQLKDMNAFLYGDDGKKVSKAVFMANATKYYRDAGTVDGKYFSWLKVEWEQADITAEQARNWQDLQNNTEVLNLIYETAGDDRVRPAHAAMNGTVKPKNDPIWLIWFAPNGWLCRCKVIPTDNDITTHEITVKPDPGFAFNCGVDGQVYGTKHPYYANNNKERQTVASNVDKLAARENARLNRPIYNQYAKDDNYTQQGFNEGTGGFKVSHKDASKYLPHEVEMIDELVSRGNRVVLPKEIKAEFQKGFDAIVNDSNFDLKRITGKPKDRIAERIEDAGTQAANVMLKLQNVDVATIIAALRNPKVLASKINTVLIWMDDKWSEITKQDIEQGLWDRLDDLK